MQTLKTIRSHTGLANFLAALDDQDDDGCPAVSGYIPRQTDIPSPYACSPTHVVYQWDQQPVIIVETAHRKYQVFAVPADITISPEDD